MAHTIHNPRTAPQSSTLQGFSVAISGNISVVGAPRDNTGAPDGGSAQVFDIGGSESSAPILRLTNSGAAAFSRFGSSVAISGSLVAVGAPREIVGA